MDLTETHNSFLSGDLSCEKIIENALSRANQENLNAFLSVFNERAMERAKELDAKRAKSAPLGKLAGVPIAIKDNILVKGEINTCASKFLENYRAPYDATVVRLLEAEDAVIIGKTNLDEFAMGGSGVHSAYAPTKNPWDTERSPGGSSSGSAACVSAGICPVSLGSDTGGSIRQPAALTGITGFKPTYGMISRFGLVAFGSSLDQIGPFTRNVHDTALVMEVISKHCERDSTSILGERKAYSEELDKPVSGSKIGVPWKFLEELQGEPRKNFEESIEVYRSLGCEIVEIELDMLNYGIAIYYIIAAAEASTNLARFDGVRYGVRSPQAKTLEEIYDFSRRDGFGEEVKNRIMLGTFVLSGSSKEAYYQKGQKVRTLLIKEIREAFGKCEMIALPSAPGEAFPLNAMQDPLQEYLQDLYTVGANMAGLPAISIPSGFSTGNRPFGLQLWGPQTHDLDVLRFAYAFEEATEFAMALPPGFGGGR